MSMRVVLDTNALLISIPTRSKYRPIFTALINDHFELAISNEILSEYIEIIEQKANAIVAKNIAEMLLNLENVLKTEIYYKWHLIEADKDDNKFVDCAIAANVRYIVTNDKHFRILRDIPFPKVEVISIRDFLAEVKKLQ